MFISPALTLYVSFKENNLVVKKWVIILLITVFGSQILFTPTGDGTRYIQVVENHYMGMNFTGFIEGMLNIIRLTPDFYQRGDPYVHIISYISGGVFQSTTLFFVIVSFIFGYFYTNSLFNIFYKFKIKKFTFPIILFGAVLIFWEGIEGINTVRTWTGAWVLFYGTINYFEKKQANANHFKRERSKGLDEIYIAETMPYPNLFHIAVYACAEIDDQKIQRLIKERRQQILDTCNILSAKSVFIPYQQRFGDYVAAIQVDFQ